MTDTYIHYIYICNFFMRIHHCLKSGNVLRSEGVHLYDLYDSLMISGNSADTIKRFCWSKSVLQGAMQLLTTNHSCRTNGGPEALVSTTIFRICGEHTSSGWQERYFLKIH